MHELSLVSKLSCDKYFSIQLEGDVLREIYLNSSVFIENLPSSERARVCARPYHAKNDAQKGCAV